jgi:NhaP-type Na+/H+ or K+/H+ antiporter
MPLSTIELYVHIGALFFAGASVLAADSIGTRWLLGTTPVVNHAHARTLHYTTGSALLLLIVSGVTLFWPMHDYLLHDPLFLIKMGFVGALLVNSILIDRLMDTAASVPFAQLARSKQIQFVLSGAVSLACWVGAALCGYFLFP